MNARAVTHALSSVHSLGHVNPSLQLICMLGVPPEGHIALPI